MSPLGLASVTARITELQQRFAPVPSFGREQVAGAQAGAGVGDRPPALAGAVPATAPERDATPAAPPVGTAAAGSPAGAPQPAGAWAARLPAAGQRWASAIGRAADSEGVEPALLAALVGAESGYRAEARSPAGAIGLGQLMPATARGLGVDPHDPQQNLTGAARYLKQQLDRFGSVELALAAYNAGPGRVAQAGGVPRISETQRYVATVTAAYHQLRST